MLKKLFKSYYVIAGVIVFVIVFAIGVWGVGFSWLESFLGAAAITVVGIVTLWWKEHVW